MAELLFMTYSDVPYMYPQNKFCDSFSQYMNLLLAKMSRDLLPYTHCHSMQSYTNDVDEIDTKCCKCVLCDALQDRRYSAIAECDVDLDPSFLTGKGSVVLIPDISPIVPGHQLLVTRKHLASFALAGPSEWADLTKIREAAVSSLKNPSAGYFFFEHGAAPCQSPSVGCVAHAHIHMIPMRFDMPYYLRQHTSQLLKLAPIDMMSALPKSGCDYWYFEDDTGVGCVITEFRKYSPRQFVRMAVAAELDLPEWDWRILAENAS